MHDPMVVAHEIPSPIPRRVSWREHGDRRWGFDVSRRTNAENRGERTYPWWRPCGYTLRLGGRAYGLGRLATIWHIEPGGHDSGEVCKHYLRGAAWASTPEWKARLNPFIKPLDGGKWAADRSWKWHVHHWHIQIPALQSLRARLFDRCAECGRKGSPNISHQWDSPPIGWRKWRSRPGSFHRECSDLVHLRRQRGQDEDLIRHLVAALRVQTDESEAAVIARLTDPKSRGLEFGQSYRLTRLLGYERNDDYELVRKASTRA